MTDDHIRVTGTAERTVEPGSAAWRAETVESDADPRAAFERCSSRLNALVARLAEVGEVATEAVVVQPRFEKQKPVGAEAIGAVRVRSPAGRAGEVAQAAMVAGADRLHGPWFEYEDEEPVRGELLGEAVADARRKAGLLAAAAGRRAGAARQIEEARTDRPPIPRAAALASAEFQPPDVRPRELTVTASVSVVFALED